MGKHTVAVSRIAMAVALSFGGLALAASQSAAERTCFADTKATDGNRQRIDACTALLRNETSDEGRVQILIARSDSYYRSGSPLRALADLQQIETIDPSRIEISFGRAFVFSAMGYYSRALPEIERAMRGGIHSAEAYSVRGTIYAYQGRYGDAIQDLELSITSDPTIGTSYAVRGFANLEIGEIERAIKDLDEAIRLEPKNDYAYFYRGCAHLALDQYKDALADFTQAHRLMPDQPDATDYIDEVTAMMTAAETAPASVPAPLDPQAVVPSKAVGSSHNCDAYYPFLSNWTDETGDVLIHYDVAADGVISNVGIDRSSGFDRLDRASVICVSRHWRSTPATRGGVPFPTPRHLALIRYMNHNTGALSDVHRGETFEGLGEYERAIAAFDTAIAEDPHGADAYFHRGMTHYLQQDYSGAIRDFDSALRLKPDFDEAVAGRELSSHAALRAAPSGGKGI